MKALPAVLFLALCASAWAAPTPGEVRRAMASYRAGHPVCEVCGKAPTFLRRLEVAHLLPQAAFPDRAADTNIMMMAHRDCHFCVLHAGDFKKYVVNPRAWLATRAVKENVHE